MLVVLNAQQQQQKIVNAKQINRKNKTKKKLYNKLRDRKCASSFASVLPFIKIANRFSCKAHWPHFITLFFSNH